MQKLKILTTEKRQIIDITQEVSLCSGKGVGLLFVWVRHTTAAVTAADLDPGTDVDLLKFLDSLVPEGVEWLHPHAPQHAPDHLLAALVGPGLHIPCEDGRLLLGTWQRIILVEFDGPREREVVVTCLPEPA